MKPECSRICKEEDDGLCTPFFSVCLITFRRSELLKRCLEHLIGGRQTLAEKHYEIVVSDDDPEGSAKPIVDSFPGVRWVQGPGRGVAANRNCVAKAARGKWIVYVDDDELPEPDWLLHLHEVAATGDWDVVEGKVEPVNYPDSVFWYAPTVPWGGIYCTANLAIRREALLKLGGFDERLRTSHEDMELGGRIREAGMRTHFAASAVVKHPARRLTLREVWRRMIQQQCQTYALAHRNGSPGGSELMSLPVVFSWSLRYWVRCLRIQWAIEGKKVGRRLVEENFLRALNCPFAIIHIVKSYRLT